MIETTVRLPAGDVWLEGALHLPLARQGLVLFAHGSGSSRHSPRNRAVAGVLQAAGLGSLLMDLLTADEEREDARTGHLRFDIPRLASRLLSAAEWLEAQPDTAGTPLGIFGASTGAGAALVTAAERPAAIQAVVSRGGRPDLAGDALARVRAPTLFIVGGDDVEVLALNRAALERLPGEKRLEIIPGATHLFEEPGALEEVARLATDWFGARLAGLS